jgi:hypothetical protein
LPADRFFEIFALPEAFATFADDPFFNVFGGLFGGASDALIRLGEVPNRESWDRYFSSAALAAASGGDHLTATIQLIERPRRSARNVE